MTFVLTFLAGFYFFNGNFEVFGNEVWTGQLTEATDILINPESLQGNTSLLENCDTCIFVLHHEYMEGGGKFEVIRVEGFKYQFRVLSSDAWGVWAHGSGRWRIEVFLN